MSRLRLALLGRLGSWKRSSKPHLGSYRFFDLLEEMLEPIVAKPFADQTNSLLRKEGYVGIRTNQRHQLDAPVQSARGNRNK